MDKGIPHASSRPPDASKVEEKGTTLPRRSEEHSFTVRRESLPLVPY